LLSGSRGLWVSPWSFVAIVPNRPSSTFASSSPRTPAAASGAGFWGRIATIRLVRAIVGKVRRVAGISRELIAARRAFGPPRPGPASWLWRCRPERAAVRSHAVHFRAQRVLGYYPAPDGRGCFLPFHLISMKAPSHVVRSEMTLTTRIDGFNVR
jgi:hypothetical protein